MARVRPAPRMIPKPSEEKGNFPDAIKKILMHTNNPIEPTRMKKLESLRMPCPFGCKINDVAKYNKKDNNYVYHTLRTHPDYGICLFPDKRFIFRGALVAAEQAAKLFC